MVASTVEGQIPELLFARLATFSNSPAVQIAWPDITFEPSDGVAYLDVAFIPNRTLTRAIGDTDDTHHQGMLQIAIMHPQSAAPGVVSMSDLAGDIITHFKKGTLLSGSLVSVKILRHPWTGAAYPDGNRIRLPITIPYVCFVAAQ